MNLEVEIINKQKIAIDKLLKASLSDTYQRFGPNRSAWVEVLITDNEEIKILNRDYRGKDQPTDVLSFPVSIDSQLGQVVPDNEVLALGTIVISFEQAEQQVGRFGKDLNNELIGLAQHGLRHLLGHTHDNQGNWQ
ncbi:rRNA maturation RNase YbeY [Candidatus Berkelbacteria bacterium]|nr:rRNA maturation RNase YbeY [Candidatus Berkelbacteria bacterium]